VDIDGEAYSQKGIGVGNIRVSIEKFLNCLDNRAWNGKEMLSGLLEREWQ